MTGINWIDMVLFWVFRIICWLFVISDIAMIVLNIFKKK